MDEETIETNDEIFNILGVYSREDCYTNLIAYAFNHHFAFRKELLVKLEEDDDQNWTAELRPQVLIRSNTKRKKDVPDLLLVNRLAKKACVIENKIFSGEGWEQTKRYASDEFKKGLIAHLKVKELTLRYFFLRLDETKPASSQFTTLSYSDIANCIPQRLGDSNLDILLAELREQIHEYEEWPRPRDTERIIEYLNRGNRLVNSTRTFQLTVDTLFPRQRGFEREFGKTGHRGSGNILYCVWYKDLWRGEAYSEETDGTACYDIHFEFQWDTKKEKETLWLFLHYHTNPYMTKKVLGEKPETFRRGYTRARNKFHKQVKQSLANGSEQDVPSWRMNKTVLRIAQYSVETDATFEQLKEIAPKLIDHMTTMVDQYFS